MKIIIENSTSIPNKFIRFFKWKLYGLKDKFQKLIYANVHIKSLKSNPSLFEMVLKLGIRGRDIVIKRQAGDIYTLYNSIHKIAHMKLAEIHR